MSQTCNCSSNSKNGFSIRYLFFNTAVSSGIINLAIIAFFSVYSSFSDFEFCSKCLKKKLLNLMPLNSESSSSLALSIIPSKSVSLFSSGFFEVGVNIVEVSFLFLPSFSLPFLWPLAQRFSFQFLVNF